VAGHGPAHHYAGSLGDTVRVLPKHDLLTTQPNWAGWYWRGRHRTQSAGMPAKDLKPFRQYVAGLTLMCVGGTQVGP